MDDSPKIDRYTRVNASALIVFDERGGNEFNGVDGRTLHALANRGLVWFERVAPWAKTKRYRGGLTPKGRRVLELLEPHNPVQGEAGPVESIGIESSSAGHREQDQQ
ncbi:MULTISPECIES: hypothetical protein [Microbacterium]|uniref:Uncharacterized protein n=1 Tax=Microbacterium hominis TaxID=162426 RepID=A0A2K9DBD3_9MICO|nr:MULTISPECIES: hypothetical protein [Microbacterium]AUG29421.1 hypothetical protein CXR34_08075 [Microbacterium hominis]EPD84111.1 hypothetical protein HMPREF1529_02151 [Microbacterium sp. oral taxon 186 str. F0373]